MHNVKKTPASDAINAAYEAKRKAKLQHFVEIRNKIFDKKLLNELDAEVLRLTGELLEKNPDIYTLWNLRRSAILNLQKVEDETDDQLEERRQKLLKDELDLTTKALVSNPKSYAAWFQRFWILNREKNPDLLKELALCKKALMMDCRNFHCWDHRRLVVRLANISPEDELAFSDELIKANPSNYSAWHYRGLLLTKIRPDQSGYGMPISEESLKDEFEKIEQICSYNSEDQTSWTYARWLSECGCPISQRSFELLTVSFLSQTEILLIFSDPVSKNEVLNLVIDPKSLDIIPITRKAHVRYQKRRNWIITFDAEDASNGITYRTGSETIETIKYEQVCKANKEAILMMYSDDSRCRSPVAKEALEGLSYICKELLKIDNDIPWIYVALLRTTILLNGENRATIESGVELIQKIKELDPQRSNLYDEIWDSVRITAVLRDSANSASPLDNILDNDQRQLDLRNLGLKSIERLNFLGGLITNLNLQYNNISNLKQFNILPALQYLTLDDNPVERIDELVSLPKLKFLSLARTPLKEPGDFAHVRKSFPSLDRLLIAETTLKDHAKEVSDVVNPPGCDKTIRIFFYYL